MASVNKMASGLEDSTNAAKTPEKKPSLPVRAWKKLDLDVKTVLMMFKGSVAPTVAISMFQATPVAEHFTTLGYLIAIMSLLGMPIMPRGKFIQTMTLNLIATGLGAAINLLALYTATQARAHTTPSGTPLTAYNSSASAVCAIWLIVQIYLVNYLRAARPQFQFPAIIYSILCMVSLSYGVSFPNMASSISFMQRLLEAFATGFAISTAVHFLVLPVTSRKVVCAEMAGFLMSISGVLKAQTAFMVHIEDLDPITMRREREEQEAKTKHKHKHDDIVAPTSAEGQALRAAINKTLELHSKINGDIVAANREFAIGKLDQKELSTFWKKSRTLLTPIMGLVSILDSLSRLATERQFSSTDLPEEQLKRNAGSIESLRMSARAMHAPLASMTETLGSGLVHVNLVMELTKPPKKSKKADVEDAAPQDPPGSATFAASFRRKLQDFESSKQVTLEDWCRQKGIENPTDFLHHMSLHASGVGSKDPLQEQFHAQIFLMLYLEYLLLRIGQIVLELILFAEQLKQDGKFKRKRLIVPGTRTISKWLKAVVGREDMTREEHFMADMEVGASEAIDLGASFGRKKDPEHLPPRNIGERIGEAIRLIPRFFRSTSSSFALRVVCATMSIAITAFLQRSQEFFLRERLLWALIMVAISMSRTAGQSTFNFLLRIGGTVIAMVGAYIIWYIVDGRTAGVIVFLWLWIFLGFYIVFKFPKFVIIGILAVVTSILIVGYELQVQKLGIELSETNGQPAYPTYLLAPYRLACVAGGLFVAWIWTVWPYPVSEHSELRKDIAGALYLLASFYSNVHEMVKSSVAGTAGDVNKKGTHAYRLDKARVKVLTKLFALLSQMQMNSGFVKFQWIIGGRYPREEYEGMIDCVRRILVATALIAHASDTLAANAAHSEEQSQWFQHFRDITQSFGDTSHRITSTLALLSSSLLTGQPLPPYLRNPKPFEGVARLEAIDTDILSIRHIAEPEYSAFVVIQLCAESLNLNLALLKKHVTTLVGEMDFSFHAPSQQDLKSHSSTDSSPDRSKIE